MGREVGSQTRRVPEHAVSQNACTSDRYECLVESLHRFGISNRFAYEFGGVRLVHRDFSGCDGNDRDVLFVSRVRDGVTKETKQKQC